MSFFNKNTAEATLKVNYDGKNAETGLKSLKKTVKTIITGYVVKQIASYSLELGKLGAQADAVAKNFANFATRNNQTVDGMMGKLKKATLGMVDDVQLQQRAMQAMVGGVSFDAIITTMEYVTKFASATGTDVTGKMMTVMTGLARGSAMFLDDVGIQVMGSKDVVNDAVAQMKEKMDMFSTSTEDASVRSAQLNANFEKMKVTIGKKLLPVFSSLVNVSNGFFESFDNKEIKKVNKEIKDIEGFIDRTYMKLSDGPSIVDKIIGSIGGSVANKNDLKEIIKTSERDLELLQQKLSKLQSGGDEKIDPKDFMKTKIQDQLNAVNEATKKGEAEKDKILAAAAKKRAAELEKSRIQDIEDLKSAQEKGLDLVREYTFGNSDAIREEWEEKQSIEKRVQDVILQDRELFYQTQYEELLMWQDKYNLTNEQYDILRTDLEKEQSKERIAISRREQDQKIGVAQDSLSALSTINEAMSSIIGESGDKAKVFARIQQGIAVAQAWVNVYKAATDVYATQFGGLITKGLAMGAAIGTGAATVAKIQSQNFQTGVVGLGGVELSRQADNFPAMIGRGESVISAPQTAMHEDTLKAIQSNTANTARGMSKMGGGNIVNNYYGISTEQLLSTRIDTNRRKSIGRRI